MHLVIIGLFTAVSFYVYVFAISNLLLICKKSKNLSTCSILVCTQKFDHYILIFLFILWLAIHTRLFSCVRKCEYIYVHCTCVHMHMLHTYVCITSYFYWPKT